MIKTHPVNLNRDPQLPTGIHDPRWKEPAVATRVALTTFQRLMMNPALFPAAVMLPAGDVNPGFKGNVDKRAFTFQPAQDIPLKKLRFKGGSYGEIHHRYSFGGRLPAVNFHAQAVIFGLDRREKPRVDFTNSEGAGGRLRVASPGFEGFRSK